jgi:tRNA G18 (ribose-2'-O)-methylase SpoU
MSKRIVILENIRSAYNVGNIIRTADSLWWEVRIVWYTPSPVDNPKVVKTSLWAENTVWLRQFDFTIDAINEAHEMWLEIIAAELTENSVSLWEYVCKSENWIAVIFGNEVDGVMEKTLKEVDAVVEIPMHWIKESMNVGQSTAIFMRELWKNRK